MPDKRTIFIQRLLPYAQRFEQQTGIPASYVLAMAANETGWDVDNPVLFGIKGKGPSGRSSAYKTWEVGPQGRYDTTAEFATYEDLNEAFQHLASNMQSTRYKDAPKTSPRAFAGYLQQKGWATDPQYSNKIASLVSQIEQLGVGGDGGTMPDDTKPNTGQTAKEQSEDVYDKLIDAQEKAKAELEKEYADLYDAYKKLDPESTTYFTESDRVKTQLQELGRQITNTQNTIQRYVQERERIRNQRTTDLDNTIKKMSAEVTAGRLDFDQAKERFDQIMRMAQQGVSNVLAAHQELREAAPRMGSRALGEAAINALRNWQQYVPGFKIPENLVIEPIPFDPRAAVAPYLPPEPTREQWQEALLAGGRPRPDFDALARDSLRALGAGYERATEGRDTTPVDIDRRIGIPDDYMPPRGNLATIYGAGLRGPDLPSGYRGGGVEGPPAPSLPPTAPARPPSVDLDPWESPGRNTLEGMPAPPPPRSPAAGMPSPSDPEKARRLAETLNDPTLSDEERRRRLAELGFQY